MEHIDKINVLVIGSGGREHAICKSLKKSTCLNTLHCFGTHDNPGICEIVDDFQLCNIHDINHHQTIISHCIHHHIGLVVVGPEMPLKNGIANDLYEYHISCIGPYAHYARIETDKAFARHLLNDIYPEVNPKYKYFKNSHLEDIELLSFIESLDNNIVIKANGLKGGKGVKVAGDHFHTKEEGLEYIKYLLSNDDDFLIEEKLEGEEFTLMSFSDGKYISHMPLVKDFKRAFDGDKGPNTGSMGSISFADHGLPFLTKEDILFCQKINQDVIQHLQNNTTCNSNNASSKYLTYNGVLYGSFIKTPQNEIKVIEFNARFGDPEVINILSILKTDLLQIFISILCKQLHNIEIEYENKHTICRYFVPLGYPSQPQKDRDIYVLRELDENENNTTKQCEVIYASVKKKNVNESNEWEKYMSHDYLCLRTLGSRAIAIISKNTTIENTYGLIENDLCKIFGAVRIRKDIGHYLIKYNTYVTTNNNSTNNDCLHIKMANTLNNTNVSQYEASGVHIDVGNQFVKDIKALIEETYNENVVSNIGDFGGIYNISSLFPNNSHNKYVNEEQLCLISSTDGVGTKSVFIEKYYGKEGYYTLGQDLVNHCVNDILVQGGVPLYFLDYFASSKLNPQFALTFIQGVVHSCKENHCVLIGGETAEMPDVYNKNRCDLVGTIVGCVKKKDIINGKQTIKASNIVVALQSSGPHTNGYSLIRKILKGIGSVEYNKEHHLPILKKLSNPHRCYLKDYLILKEEERFQTLQLTGMCHITGGGLTENTKRVLEDHLYIEYLPTKKTKSVTKTTYIRSCYNYTPEFHFLKKEGHVNDDEMLKVFNCGIGMLLFFDSRQCKTICNYIEYLNHIHNDPDYATIVGYVESNM
tara:strand:+ start:2247 stop:4862 length:2616 start_codon:yes stop_codon:yes gene_type:complete